MTEGTVTRWLKQVGDAVAVDEPLLEVSTDKVDTEIPSPVAGTLLEIKVAEDETVAVGAELAVIGAAGAAPAAPAPEAPAAPAPEPCRPARARAGAEPAPDPARSPSPSPTAPAPTPAARPAPPRPPRLPQPPRLPRRRRPMTRAATSLRWCASWPTSTASTWRRVAGTGVGGRIRKQDILDAAASAKAAAETTAEAPAAPAAAAPPPRRHHCAARPSPCRVCAR